jgi:hypothetical protein
MSETKDLDVRRACAEARWGVPGESRIFDNPGISIEVLMWPKSMNPTGVTLYVTIGVPLRSPDVSHVEEFVLGLDPDAPNAGWALAALASLRAEGKGRVGHNSTVGFGQPLWPGTRMDSVLILSYGDDDRNIPMPDGRHLDLLTVLPVFEEEVKFIQSSGTDAFMNRWDHLGVHFWDPYRQNSCA